MSSFKINVNKNIKQKAGSKSVGKCALFVREAVQLAKGLTSSPTGIESAKDYGNWLTTMGYKASNKTNSTASVGDIAVFEAMGKHSHGHIQVYCDDGKWRSDFVQNSFYPYADGTKPNYIVYE